MKKFLIAFGITFTFLALGILGWLYFRPPPEVYRAKDILPEKTIFYVALTQMATNRIHFSQTSIGKIWEEPSVKGFITLPKAKLREQIRAQLKKTPYLKKIPAIFENAEGEVFFAITSFSISPKFDIKWVLGFEPGAQYKKAKKEIDQLLLQWRTELPLSKFEEKKYRSISYTVFDFSETQQIVFANLNNFILCCSGERQLLDIVDQIQDKDSKRLSHQSIWASHEKDFEGVDCIFYFNSQPALAMVKPFLALSGAYGDSLNAIPEFYGGTLAFKESRVETKLWVDFSKNQSDQLGLNYLRENTRVTLNAAGPDTLLFYSLTVDLPNIFDQFFKNQKRYESLPQYRDLQKWIQLLTLDRFSPQTDLFCHLASEFAFIFEWPATRGLPSIHMLVELKNADVFQKNLEEIYRLLAQNSPFVTLDTFKSQSGVPITSLTFLESAGTLSPSFAIQDRFAVFSLNYLGLEQILGRREGKLEVLSNTPEFKLQDRALKTGTYQYFYFDAKKFFERIYTSVLSEKNLMRNFAVKTKEIIDIEKIPKLDEVSKHLGSANWTTRIENTTFVLEGNSSFDFSLSLWSLVYKAYLEVLKESDST